MSRLGDQTTRLASSRPSPLPPARSRQGRHATPPAIGIRFLENEAWVELDWDVGKILLREFIDRYEFRLGVEPENWPAIVELTPSVVWDLEPIFAGDYPGGFAAGSHDVAALVLGTLQDCTEWWESVVFHDWVHPSSLFRRHKVDQPEEVPGWEVGGLFPNGDFTIFVGYADAFGILGHP